MKKDIQYLIAQNDNNEIVIASDADKNCKYWCPKCKDELILHKSGKSSKGSKRPHFQHKTLTHDWDSETILHYSFKILLEDKIRKLINKERLMIEWECDSCHKYHKANLLYNIFFIKKEYNFKICQPDITLFDKDMNPIVIIEIIYTHKPENNVIEYCKKNKIIIIKIIIKNSNDLFNVIGKIQEPFNVNYCRNTFCNNFIDKYYIKEQRIENGKCCKCNNPIKILCINESFFFDIYNTFEINVRYLDDNEINWAKSNGMNIIMKYDKFQNRNIPLNICKYCGNEHFVYKR